MKILHITESFGGGVESALRSYVSNTPEAEHFLVFKLRKGFTATAHKFEGFDAHYEFPDGLFKSFKFIRKTIIHTKPDVVHVHSSIAGFLTRIGVNKNKVPIIYTPHGYSFERRDVSRLVRSIFKFIEWLLSFNTTVIAACSLRESTLSRNLQAQNVVYVPNTSESENLKLAPKVVEDIKPPMKIAVLGRITPARDPLFLVQLSNELKNKGIDHQVTWVGDGDEKDKQRLIEADITVTGWLDKKSIYHFLPTQDLLVHPAVWDGFPIAILEAHHLGLPVLARKIKAFDTVPNDLLCSDAKAMARKIWNFNDKPELLLENFSLWGGYLKVNTNEVQRISLLEIYKVFV